MKRVFISIIMRWHLRTEYLLIWDGFIRPGMGVMWYEWDITCWECRLTELLHNVKLFCELVESRSDWNFTIKTHFREALSSSRLNRIARWVVIAPAQWFSLLESCDLGAPFVIRKASCYHVIATANCGIQARDTLIGFQSRALRSAP